MGSRWLAVAALLLSADADRVVVKREGVRVMKAPRFFGEPCAVRVAPGDRLSVLERRGSWARLKSPGGGLCWVHETAWVDRSAGELAVDGAGTSPRDLELASRGFTEEQLATYQAEHPSLRPDFDIVEAYLARAPETPPDELAAFAEAGGLGGRP